LSLFETAISPIRSCWKISTDRHGLSWFHRDCDLMACPHHIRHNTTGVSSCGKRNLELLRVFFLQYTSVHSSIRHLLNSGQHISYIGLLSVRDKSTYFVFVHQSTNDDQEVENLIPGLKFHDSNPHRRNRKRRTRVRGHTFAGGSGCKFATPNSSAETVCPQNSC